MKTYTAIVEQIDKDPTVKIAESIEAENRADAYETMEIIVARFNDTLRQNESRRKLLGIIDKSQALLINTMLPASKNRVLSRYLLTADDIKI